MSLKLTPSVEALRVAQQERYAKEHEANMAKSPWIRETINAYRNATPEQIAKVQELLKKRGLVK